MVDLVPGWQQAQGPIVWTIEAARVTHNWGAGCGCTLCVLSKAQLNIDSKEKKKWAHM